MRRLLGRLAFVVEGSRFRPYEDEIPMHSLDEMVLACGNAT